MFQAKGGTYPSGGAAHFPTHLQSHISHQVTAGPPALSARVELPCAPPSTRNAPPVHGVPNPPAYHHFPTQSAGYPNSVVSSMAAGGAGSFLGYHVAPNPVHTGHQSGSAPAHTMAGGAPQFPTPPRQSILSAFTQQTNFEERVAAAVASALRNRASTTPAKIPDIKLKGFSGKQAKWVDFHRLVCAAMELPTFFPESDELVTTGANRDASRRLRALLIGALEGNAASVDHGGRRRWRFFGLPHGAKSSPHWSPIG